LRIRQTYEVDDAEHTGSDIDTVIDGVGARLRGLRRTRSMTLADLAEATGTSQVTLSRLESGARRPSLDLLLRLARTYRVTLDELVDAPDTGDPRIHARPSVRYGVTWVPLTRRAGGLQAFKLVLDGRLRLLLGGHELVLTPGEVAEFDTHTPHAFTNPADTTTELLILISAQGQRAHVRARPARSAPNPTGRP